jgi:prepilin peptidase CpaA
MHVTPHESVAVAVALVASAFDVRTRRIPNVLTFGAAAAALVASAATAGLSGVATSAAGWLLTLAIWLPIYALGGMGAGDVKLMAAIGAWLGPTAGLFAALYAGVAGAVIAVGVAVAQRCVRQTYDNVFLLVTHWRVTGFSPHAQLTLDSSTSPKLPYAVPILAGTLLMIWLR